MGDAVSEPFAGLGPAGKALLSIGGQDMPAYYDEVREAMDAWAHELAEKIRTHAKEWQENNKYHWYLGHVDAADLIDPEGD